MRYFWALLAYVTAIVVASASCSGTGKGTGFNNSGGSAASGGVGNGAGTSTGGGGSTGVGITFSDAGPGSDGACAGYKGDCAAQKLNCGTAVDGCGNTLNCGTCTAPETCGGGGTANVCGAPPCNKQTCMSQGFDCGMATDTCGNAIDCGTCTSPDVCGANNKANVCGTGGVCVPKTCFQIPATCGMVGNGCGVLLDCGTCAANQSCTNGSCVSSCVPKTTCPAGLNCGVVSDGCTGVISCGSCSGNQTCGANAPNVCGTSANCTGLCLQQTSCPGTTTTTVTGTVFAPNGTDPLPSTLVYVPNAALQPFPAGVSCGSCTSEVSGSPLVSTTTNFDGTFTLTNVPVGTNIPLVIQKGRWRRSYTVPSVAACVNTALPSSGAQQLRMPQKENEFTAFDNIPLMAFVTGSVDALECVLRKVGIADSQFSDPTGTGRVRFFMGSGSAGARYSASTPSETTLWGSQATVDQYDIVYFACQGDDYEKTPAQQQIMVDYANAGGRIFATHYSYVWLTNTAENAVWSPTATWNQANEGAFYADPGTGLINTTAADPRPTILAKWLQFIGASTTYGQMSVNTLRNDFSAVTSPALLWISDNDVGVPPFFPGLGDVPLHYTFDTPWGTPPANQCGRVLYSDFHVEDATTGGTTFPNECTSPTMTPQEKMLEFMIFDLGSCVSPPICTPKTCASQGAMCGEVGNGCDSTTILMCGSCPSGQTCTAGVCTGNGCVPQTCTEEGFNCGMQGDGCGNSINCGTCPSGQTCGAGGKGGVCGSGSCNPTTCSAKGVMCGSIGDGCGNLLNCGTCPQGEICGGGVNPKPGICGMNACVPKTCAQQNFNCGAASDGCGNIIQCGTCAGVQTCGGSGSPNVCGGGA